MSHKNTLFKVYGTAPVLYDIDASDAVATRDLVEVAEELERRVLHRAVRLVRNLHLPQFHVVRTVKSSNVCKSNERDSHDGLTASMVFRVQRPPLP